MANALKYRRTERLCKNNNGSINDDYNNNDNIVRYALLIVDFKVHNQIEIYLISKYVPSYILERV